MFRILLLLLALHGMASASVVFSTDFNQVSGSGTFLGAGTLTDVTPGNGFVQNTSPGRPATATRLHLNNLPSHQYISLVFTLWVLDSWDGTSNTCCGVDLFTVRLDGNTVFSGAFRNWGISPARLDSVSPPGVATLILGANTQLAANPIWSDSVWLITLNDLPHLGSSAVFEFFAGGSGWDGGTDESFGLDNVTVEVLQVPEPATLMLMWMGAAALAMSARCRVRSLVR